MASHQSKRFAFLKNKKLKIKIPRLAGYFYTKRNVLFFIVFVSLLLVLLALAVTCLEGLAVLWARCCLAGSWFKGDSFTASCADVVFFHRLLLCVPAGVFYRRLIMRTCTV